jgi:hypothetical protein
VPCVLFICIGSQRPNHLYPIAGQSAAIVRDSFIGRSNYAYYMFSSVTELLGNAGVSRPLSRRLSLQLGSLFWIAAYLWLPGYHVAKVKLSVFRYDHRR